jgi:hypothetical protein
MIDVENPEKKGASELLYSIQRIITSRDTSAMNWHTAQSGSGGSTIVLLGIFVHDWDEPADDPRTQNRREVHSSLIHNGVACCCRRDSGSWDGFRLEG